MALNEQGQMISTGLLEEGCINDLSRSLKRLHNSLKYIYIAMYTVLFHESLSLSLLLTALIPVISLYCKRWRVSTLVALIPIYQRSCRCTAFILLSNRLLLLLLLLHTFFTPHCWFYYIHIHSFILSLGSLLLLLLLLLFICFVLLFFLCFKNVMHSSSCITTRPYYVINVRLFEITDFDGTNLMTDEQQAVKMGPYPKALQAIFAVEKSLRSHVEEECKNKGIPHDPVSKEMREMKMEPEPDVDFHEELKFSVQVSYYYYILYPNTSCIYTHYNTVLHAAYEFSNNNDIKPIVTIYF